MQLIFNMLILLCAAARLYHVGAHHLYTENDVTEIFTQRFLQLTVKKIKDYLLRCMLALPRLKCVSATHCS